MTALAQCLLDAGKKVSGSDVAERFVTQEVLESRNLEIDLGFDGMIPSDVDCVIYTAAHQAQDNPQVVQALQKGLVITTHAEALASLFNQKLGIAVCGVGGKSTTSAMIAWMLQKSNLQPSFAVGVGDIIGLGKTGKWSQESLYFVAEADEYVTDPAALKKNQAITPRFSFLEPYITICTNLAHDHPDVYSTFEDTKKAFKSFFQSIKPGGWLIVNGEDLPLLTLARDAFHDRLDHLQTYAVSAETTSFEQGLSKTTLTSGAQLVLKLPGTFNIANAVAAIMTVEKIGMSQLQAAASLASFASTSRRCQKIAEIKGVVFYDDYGHHPSEVAQVISAFKDWYPARKLVVAFQSHTFSRTKAFFDDFVTAFKAADEVVMIDIFASAREPFDHSITSTMLCQAISHNFPKIKATNLVTLENLAQYCRTMLLPESIFLTLGAGDIYKVHELLKKN